MRLSAWAKPWNGFNQSYHAYELASALMIAAAKGHIDISLWTKIQGYLWTSPLAPMEYATAICQALSAILPYAEVQSHTLSVSGDQYGRDRKVYDSQVACSVDLEVRVYDPILVSGQHRTRASGICEAISTELTGVIAQTHTRGGHDHLFCPLCDGSGYEVLSSLGSYAPLSSASVVTSGPGLCSRAESHISQVHEWKGNKGTY